MAELKPCPFCGGKAEIRSFRTFIEHRHVIGDKFYVTCRECLIDGPGHHLTAEEAAEAWNRRADGAKFVQATITQNGDNNTCVHNVGTMNINM